MLCKILSKCIHLLLYWNVLSFYSDGYCFLISFHVVAILQAFGLAIIIVVDPSSTPFFHFGYLVVNFFSRKFYFSFFLTPLAY